ncbi:tail protein [Sorangium cellulosum]|uniref:Tail protein n=1 Tax=Sorangium cellulosum TaxID=56 RepID=A0A4P2Q243_SORCE|nr:phage tail sheath C-terminal domain-containing protein [Sorangium cellulosum]AUX23324.1 tail protein [Sorangium cellulosum]
MPANLTAPGVYIEEIPSGVRTIVGVSTSVTAFIGRARRGPVDVATRVTSFGEFDRVFGGLWSQSDLGHVVSHFFQNGGREAVIVRVHAGAIASTATVPGDMVLTATADAAALSGFDHLRVAVTHEAAPEAYALQITAEDAEDAALTDGDGVAYQVTIPLSLEGDPAAAIAGATTGTAPAIALAELSSAPPAARPSATAGVRGTGDAVRLPIPGALSFAAANPGTWGDQVRVTISPTGPTFTLQARLVDATGRELESEIYYGLVHTQGALTYIGDVLRTRSSLLRLAAVPTAVPAVEASATLSSGSDGTPPAIGAYEGNEASRTGLYALDELDVVNLLCVPFPAEDVTQIDEAARAGFWSGKALPWCRARGAFALIDPPPSWSSFDAVSADLANAAGWMSSLQSPHGAQYFPNVRAPDPLQENRLRTFAPSGVIAGVFARTDGARGVWKAPAGLEATLAGVLDLTVGLTDGEQGTLNREGVNCLRAFAGAGRVAWGARTLTGQDRAASEWKYVPVRRLASYLQQTLLRGTRWAVFEGNDEPLWSQLRLNIGAFMHQLFRQGAFAGRTPAEAYFVKCDADTTTQADIDAGIVNVIIGFAPVKPAEFVVIKLQQIAGQST